MKAISLWQPWASLMEVGAKLNETRSWPVKYRGELAICAANHWDADCFAMLMAGVTQHSLMPTYSIERPKLMPDPVFKSDLPFGKVLCVVNLDDCVPTLDNGSAKRWTAKEYAFGDYSPNRYAWMTSQLRRLHKPVPVRGMQRLFDLPIDIEAEVRRQM